jgi:hypothetical protein
MAIQIIGADNSTTQDLDATFQAARVSVRPPEVTGWYSYCMTSGALAGVAATGPVWSMRYAGSNLCLVRRLYVAWATTTAFTTAQALAHELYFARSFTTSDTGQTGATLTKNMHKTSMAASAVGDIRISTTVALTPGTRTLDAQPLGACCGSSTAVGTSMNVVEIFSHNTGDYSLVLAQNEGLVLQNAIAMGAAGVIKLYVGVEYAEATVAGYF